jgi:hypothetical protein
VPRYGTTGLAHAAPSGVRSTMDRPMKCACDSVYELTGNEADQYGREHLLKLEVDAVHWTVSYRCPDTGKLWLRDSPHSELQGAPDVASDP